MNRAKGLKYEHDGLVHDSGPQIPYGGRTTACMYMDGGNIRGSDLSPRAKETPTTCVRCLLAPAQFRGY